MQIEYGVKICKDKDDDTEVKVSKLNNSEQDLFFKWTSPLDAGGANVLYHMSDTV